MTIVSEFPKAAKAVFTWGSNIIVTGLLFVTSKITVMRKQLPLVDNGEHRAMLLVIIVRLWIIILLGRLLQV